MLLISLPTTLIYHLLDMLFVDDMYELHSVHDVRDHKTYRSRDLFVAGY